MKRGAILVFLAAILLALGVCSAHAATVGGVVWLDKSVDGLYQPSEGLVSGAEVALMSEDEQRVAAVTTARDGAFTFADVPDGRYFLALTLPKEHIFTMPGLDSAALPADGNIGRTALFDAAGDTRLNVGATKSTSYINFIAFEDQNANGGRFSTEPFIRDVVVQLLYETPQGGTAVVAEAKTNKDGIVTFRDLTPATYRLAVTLPGMYVIGPLGAKLNTFYNCVPPTDSNSGITAPFNLAAKGSVGLAVGAVKTGAVAGGAWADTNFDGVRGADEIGFANARMTLESPSLGVTRTVMTGGDGKYSFENLQPGAYRLTATLPEGSMFSPEGDLMTDGASEQSVELSVTVERTTTLADIGVMPATSLAVTLFIDRNADGMQDADDPAFAGATVRVLRDGKEIASAVSDGAGVASVPVLRGGNASVVCTLPDGQVFTVAGGEGGNQFVTRAAASECALDIDIPHAAHTALRAGVTIPASVSGMLFEDLNQDGVMNGGEKGLAGFTVQAVDALGNVAATAVTDGAGEYAFTSLLPAAHVVRFLLQDPYVFSDASETGAQVENKVTAQTPEYGETEALALAPGQSVARVDGGAFKAGVIVGSVKTDDGGMPNVALTLLTEAGEPVSEHTVATTDENGDFYLKGALPGTYALRYELPADTAFVEPFIEESGYVTAPFTVSVGEEKAMPPLQAVYTATLSGVSYFDADGSGAFGGGDEPLEGVELTLQSEATGYLYHAVSDASGAYAFTGVRPAEYLLSGLLPEGMAFGFSDASPLPAVAASESSAEITLTAGQRALNADIPTLNRAALTCRLFYDLNNDGAYQDGEPFIEGMEVRLYDARSGKTLAAAASSQGVCQFPALIPGDYEMRMTLAEDHVPSGAHAGAFVEGEWRIAVTLANEYAVTALDTGILRYAALSGSFWSMDGTMDGVAGLQVTLAGIDVNAQQTVVTGDTGAFRFDKLVPGNYRLTSALPEGYRYARLVDTETRASRIFADGDLVYSDTAQVLMGEHIDGFDVGIGALGKLGDFAWLDENGNGMQDGGEPGVPGVTVQLWQYGAMVAQQTTDLYGRYLFTGVYPGAYEIKVSMHDELKTTAYQTEFPLVASVLPEGETGEASVSGVVVPSGGANLACDLGFALVKSGAYPAVMNNLPTTDWSPINNRGL